MHYLHSTYIDTLASALCTTTINKASDINDKVKLLLDSQFVILEHFSTYFKET